MGIFDKAKDMLGGAAGDAKLPDLGALDLGAIADKAKAVGLDPEQVKGLIAKFTGGDGKLDLNGLLEKAKSLGLDVDRLKGLFGK
jgi:hypothetical protein